MIPFQMIDKGDIEPKTALARIERRRLFEEGQSLVEPTLMDEYDAFGIDRVGVSSIGR